MKVFGLKNGGVKKPWTMIEFPMPNQVITLVEKWVYRSSREDTQSRLALLNLHKQKFHCANKDVDNSESLVEYTHQEISAQTPGIDLEVEQNIYCDMTKIISPRIEEFSFEASNNYGLEPETPGGVKECLQKYIYSRFVI